MLFVDFVVQNVTPVKTKLTVLLVKKEELIHQNVIVNLVTTNMVTNV